MLPGILRDTFDRGRMRVGKESQLEILAPGQKSQDPYEMNGSEHFEFANKLFGDGRFDEAQVHLDALFAKQSDRRRFERDIARMLLWIHTGREKLDAARIVEMFEILRERHPELVIPFDKTLTVGRAYREIGEFERAWLVFQAAIESSFLNDARLSAVLEDQGQYLGSTRYQEELWSQYPDSADVTTAYFALSQSLFQKAPEAKAIAARERSLRGHRPGPVAAAAAEASGDPDPADEAGEARDAAAQPPPAAPLPDPLPQLATGRRRRLLRGERVLRPQRLPESGRACGPERRTPQRQRAQDKLRIHGRARTFLATPL